MLSASTCARYLLLPSAWTIHLPGAPAFAVWPNSNPFGGCPTASSEKSTLRVAPCDHDRGSQYQKRDEKTRHPHENAPFEPPVMTDHSLTLFRELTSVEPRAQQKQCGTHFRSRSDSRHQYALHSPQRPTVRSPAQAHYRRALASGLHRLDRTDPTCDRDRAS